MPSNLNTLALKLNQDFPNRLGLLLSPKGFANPRGLPFAIDNGRFPVWSKGLEWKENEFWEHIQKCKSVGYPPLWLAVPDVVANAEATFEEWRIWHPKLDLLGWPLALVVQDGMNVETVKKLLPQPTIIFIGGSTEWKWRNLIKWTSNFPRVHVGRVNSGRLLWIVHRSGAESSDGTGWFHHTQKKQLIRYLKRSNEGLEERNVAGFFY